MTYRNFILTATALVAGIVPAAALDVNLTEAGTLSENIKAPAEVTRLTVTGPVNAADLFFIGSEMKALESVDLGGVTIETYNNIRLNGKTVYPASTIPEGAFAGSSFKSIVLPAQPGLVIGESAFLNSAISSLSFPSGLTSVGTGAFAACNNLTEVTLPDCTLGTSVFADCTGLVTADISAVSEIPASTFAGCTALTTVIGAKDITVIGARAFEGDTSLTNFDFGKNLNEIGASAFAGTGLAEADLSRAVSLTELPEQAFADASLTSVALPENLTAIGSGAFFGNNTLQNVELPAQVLTIGDHALTNLPLEKIDLPENLESLGAYSLFNQSKISTLVLPANLIYIGDNAMEGMTGLQNIDAKQLQQVPELGESVWEGVDQKNVSLSVMESLKDEFQSADQWKEFTLDITSRVDEITPETPGSTGVKGRFVGTELQIVSNWAEIDIVRLYDISGRQLLVVEPRDTNVAIETSDFNGNIFIVNVLLNDKDSATLKLARH